MMKKRCPKCGGGQFLSSGHVVQEWVLDENGIFVECRAECLEVTHTPDDEDLWACCECGFEAAGAEFNVSQQGGEQHE